MRDGFVHFCGLLSGLMALSGFFRPVAFRIRLGLGEFLVSLRAGCIFRQIL